MLFLRLVSLPLVATLLFAGCGGSSRLGPDDLGAILAGKADGFPLRLEPGEQVRLQRVVALYGTVLPDGRWVPHGSQLDGFGRGGLIASRASGVVAVSGSGRAGRQVVIHFQSRLSNDWSEPAWDTVPAAWVRDNLWEFRTPPLRLGGSYHYFPKLVHTFAVEVRAPGGVYWDNNDGANYRVSAADLGGFVPLDWGPMALLPAGDLVVEHAQWDGASLNGSVIVRNVAYEKVVRVVYSVDDWQTVKTGTASWARRGDGDLEHWTFRLPAPADDGERVAFAVSLRAAGRTGWDNNLGRDYWLRLDGAQSPFALGDPVPMGQVVFEGPDRNWEMRWIRRPDPVAGALMVIYDPSRLADCRGGSWSISPFWSAGGAGFAEGSFGRDEAGAYPLSPSGAGVLRSVPISTGAGRELTLYFENADDGGCRAWDSNFGQNFTLRW